MFELWVIGLIILGIILIVILFWLLLGKRDKPDPLFRYPEDDRNRERDLTAQQRLNRRAQPNHSSQWNKAGGSGRGYASTGDPYHGGSSNRPAGTSGVYSSADQDYGDSSFRSAGSPAGGGIGGGQTAQAATAARRDEAGPRRQGLTPEYLYQWVEYLNNTYKDMNSQLTEMEQKLSLAADQQEISRQVDALKADMYSRWSTLQAQMNQKMEEISTMVEGMADHLAGMHNRQQEIEHQLAAKEPALGVLAGMVEENEHIKKAMQDLIHFRRADDYTLAPEAMRVLEQVRERLTATTQQLGELAKQVKQEQGLPTVLEKFSELGGEIRKFLDGLRRKEVSYETRVSLDPSHRDVGYEMSLGLTKAHDRLNNPGAAFQRQYEDLLRSYLVPLLVNLEDRRKTQMQLDLILNAVMTEAQISPYEPVGSEFNGEKMIPDSIDDANPKNIVCGVKTRGFYYGDKLLLPPRVIIGGRSMG
jgi:hypothetical protein